MVRRIRKYKAAKRRCLVVKYAKDCRYSETKAATHDLDFSEAISCEALRDVNAGLNDCDVIGVDEAQFFPDIVEYAEQWANEGKVVIVAALDGTFQRKVSPSVRLIQ